MKSILYCKHFVRSFLGNPGKPQNQCQAETSVAATLKSKVSYWENTLEASPFVLDIIKEGYRIPFTSEPPPSYDKNNASATRNREFVEKSIKELLADGRIRETKIKPHNVNPLSVSEGQKLRLVLDLRNVNPYVNNVKFKYEGLKTASDLLEKDDFMATFDLKNGYHHIPIDENFQGYLGFAWTFADGSTKFYVYTVLPFGLSSASYVFTKFTRPLIKKWRAAGIKNIMYLDDGIIIAPTSDTAKQICETIRQDLKGAGVTLNEEKTN